MAHVRAYTRVKDGKTQIIPAHDDKRHKSSHATGMLRHVVRVDLPGASKMRETITKLLRTEEGLAELSTKIKAGGFSKAIPEVGMLYGLEQGRHHLEVDAFEHTLRVIRQLPADASDNVRWGALLHDIGKGVTQELHPTRGIIFDGHAYIGSKMVSGVLHRLGFKSPDYDEIKYLVLHHGDIRGVFIRGKKDFARKYMEHPYFESLLTLHQADVRASWRDPSEVVTAVNALKAEKAESLK